MTPPRHLLILGLLLTAGPQAVAAPASAETTPEALPGTEAFIYRDGPQPLRLFVVKPKDWKAGDKRPALVFYFGGGWTTGTPASSVFWARFAAELGLVGIAPDYRTKGRFDTPPQAAVADARASLRWVQTHATELGIDPARIAVGGNSAGGHVALWTALSSVPPGSDPAESPLTKPAALVLFSAVSDTSSDTGYTPQRFGADATALSPVHQLDATMPPVLAFHGDADKLVPLNQATALRDKLNAAGNIDELHIVPGGGHNFGNDVTEWQQKSRDILRSFLQRLDLVPPGPKEPPAFGLPAAAAAQREFYLAGIDLLRDYRPGKVSYVESPERRPGFHQRKGDRFTLLDVTGAGSIRHLWTTFQPRKGDHRLHFYLDGAAAPTWSGTPAELIARLQYEQRLAVPVPAFIGRNFAYNLYTPLAFAKSARVELEVIDPMWINFYQIDYRTEERSVPRKPLPVPAGMPHVEQTSSTVTIPAGEAATILAAEGPAIVRRWTLRTDLPLKEHRRLDLRIRYDDSGTDAVAATLGDFFGPFRSIALDTDEPAGTRTSWLPMPFAKKVRIQLQNRSGRPVTIETTAEIESLPLWRGGHGYFHALGQTTAPTTGWRQHQVLYVRGRGHWLGMSLFNTGHDHGGGDFAVIDGEGARPAFLHGINGEDYFTFAWFGQGANHPFAVAHPNAEGRIRFHFENPYPFHESLSLYWGTYPNLATRSVAYWYQDSPEDTTVPDAENPRNVEWDCFGPVRVPLDAQHQIAGDFAAALPSVAELDAGKTFRAELVEESFTRGWMKQLSIGPTLDLTYLARQGTRVKVESELGGLGHAYLARRLVTEPVARDATVRFSHDDAVRVLLNGREVFRSEGQPGFATVEFPVSYRAGKNEVVVQLLNQFNTNFNWAAFTWLEE